MQTDTTTIQIRKGDIVKIDAQDADTELYEVTVVTSYDYIVVKIGYDYPARALTVVSPVLVKRPVSVDF